MYLVSIISTRIFNAINAAAHEKMFGELDKNTQA
jgi:hypothetical protein